MDALKWLLWLPIRYHVDHKMLTLVYKCLHDKAPDYLKNLLTVIGDSERSMRLNSQYMRLLIPKTTKEMFAARSFSVKGAELWNNLPNSVKISSSVNDFKAKLKTFLFTKAYTDSYNNQSLVLLSSQFTILTIYINVQLLTTVLYYVL